MLFNKFYQLTFHYLSKYPIFAAQILESYTMAITRLKRKALRNKLTSKLRNQKLALESSTPVIKNVDIEALKEEFKKAPKAAKAEKATTAKVEVKEEAPKKVAAKKPVAKKEVAPKAEKKEAKKAPAKKAAPKKD